SAGRPLAHTPPGTFLCLLAEAAEAGFAPVQLLALLKHPLCAAEADGYFRVQVRSLDRLLRGPRPDPGLDGVREAIVKRREEQEDPEQQGWLSNLLYWFTDDVATKLRALEEAFAAKDGHIPGILEAHLAAAQSLAGNKLWHAEAGDIAGRFVEELMRSAEGIPA